MTVSPPPHHIIPGDGPLSTAGSGCDMTRLVASVCGHAKLTDNTVSSRGSANAHSCCYNHSTGFREKKWTDRMKTAGDKPREAVAFNQAILLSVMDKTGTGWCCCNLSGGVALNVWFTTNGKCVKNNTDIYVAWTSNKRVIAARDLYCCLLPQCEALRTCCSFRSQQSQNKTRMKFAGLSIAACMVWRVISDNTRR